MRDFYAVLQVAPTASATEIKSAFRNLAKTCHPDVRPGDREAEAAFQEAKRAYQLLSNPEGRKVYDAYLARLRAAERTRRRRAATTMSMSFLITGATVVLVAIWLRQGDAMELPRELAQTPAQAAQQAAQQPTRGDTGPAATAPAQPPAAVRRTPARP